MNEFMVRDKVKLAKWYNNSGNLGYQKIGRVISINAKDKDFPKNTIRVIWRNLSESDYRKNGHVYEKETLILAESLLKRLIKQVNNKRK